MSPQEKGMEGIAVVGMAGRFPKASSLDEFWRNLCEGVESISFFTDEELSSAGIATMKDNPRYVKARGLLEGAELFDASFFGVNPKEAEVMDPQHRVFLECAWEALEDAGCDPERFDGAIGVFAGMSMNTYLAHNLASHPELIGMLGDYPVMLGNDKDFLPTRVSYKLNLRGPSLNIQTACSTSLVAVCVACQHLLSHQCDAALAGAVSISFPQKKGYLYQEGGIASPDGHCRAFDAKAAGTVVGEGAGIVVLKRLSDALANGDFISAVIKGFATNNDGSLKAGFTAPSVDGQAEVIAMAQAVAGVAPETISYVEAHGTGTPLGDPIEMEGLTKAFRDGTQAQGFCAVGSVKGNIGHLDAAAGIAGLIKTVLALKNRKIPPSLHFESPNPKLDLASSPFHVASKLKDWTAARGPRRAGVSSFGIGGTNAHVVLEEAPVCQTSLPSPRPQLLVISAKTTTALEAATANLAGHLKENPDVNLADAAFTLQLGRRDFTHRRMLVCQGHADAISILTATGGTRLISQVRKQENPPVVFMFPGQGAQHLNMGVGLYRTEPGFRAEVDRCSEILQPALGLDLRTILYPGAGGDDEARRSLTQTSVTQPALFVIEYALARLWMSWGMHPEAMIGHSIGEYVAACLAGVFSLEHALRLVSARGRLMQQMPSGRMLAVRLSEMEIRPFLNGEVSIAAVNGPSLCVIAGPTGSLESLHRGFTERGVACTPLETSHAFHSATMEPVMKPFAELVRGTGRTTPKIPFVSNVTGTWITNEQAIDPGYWAGHLRQTVRFADGLGELLKTPERIFLEVGPGQTLSGLTRQRSSDPAQTLAISSLPHSKSSLPEPETVLTALGRLWLAGVIVDWQQFHQHEARKRIRLPTYPFERKRFFVEPARNETAQNPIPSLVHDVMQEKVLVPDDEKTAPVRAETRCDRIMLSLKRLLGEMSGRDLLNTPDSQTFVELGFDSLFLTQASLMIEKNLGVRIAFRQLLEEFTTLNALVVHIDSQLPVEITTSVKADLDQTVVEPVVRTSRTDEESSAPLTEAQREIWFASQMGDEASCAFNESIVLHLHGPMQIDVLHSALQQLVDRHDALRTTLDLAGHLQRIHPTLKLDVLIVDWSGSPSEEWPDRLDAVLAGDARCPFDLITGPLVRAQTIRLADQHYVLVVTVHHIVCDGHSLGILTRELATLYDSAIRKTGVQLKPALQFRDYARRQSTPEAMAESSMAEAYWLKEYADGTPALELPADHPRPSSWTFEGSRESRLISAGAGRDVMQFSAKQGGTLFATLLAAFTVLLHRLSGQEEIVVGIPTADRRLPGSETLLGHCVNLLPLRCRVKPGSDFIMHLAGVKRGFLDAHDHRACAFGTLIQKLNLPRNPSRMPLVSVTFNVDRLDEGRDFGGLKYEMTSSPGVHTNFDLNFNVTRVGDALRLDCRYCAALFDRETVQRWLGHFETLLGEIVHDANRGVDELPLLGEAERHQLLVEWNNTFMAYPHNKCIHTFFADQVSMTPASTAVACGHERMTYQDLDRMAERLAKSLRLLGIGPGMLVGVFLERTPEMVAAVMAVLKAGGAYVPLDPTYPSERLAFIVRDSRLKVLLTQRSLSEHLPPHDARVVCVDNDEAASEIHRNDIRSLPAEGKDSTASDLAYVLYTSGSTGRPKGVAVEHRSVVALISWAAQLYSPDELRGVLAATSMCFDLSVFELFVPLCTGGTVILVRDALELPNLSGAGEVRLINTVPSAAAELLRIGGIPSSVHTINLAGEPLPQSLVEQLYQRTSVRRIFDLYGPTEDTVYSTVALRVPGGRTTIGRPLANEQVYILDHKHQPVPVGVSGKLYLGGDGLARGYLHQTDLTAERFITSPFNPSLSARLYQTGDMARFLPDGNIEYLGRCDDQVKIRGFRIELGEVQTVLAQHSAVRECVVVARPDTAGEKRLIAYVVQEPDRAGLGISDVRHFLEKKLPDYMVPSVVVFLDALPLTTNGKVDRRALPEPDLSRSGSENDIVLPATATEELLVTIWREVLGIEVVGCRDNFFELGGHSLLVTKALSRIKETFQMDLPLRRFFESPTISALALAIEELLIEEIASLSEQEAQHVSNQQS